MSYGNSGKLVIVYIGICEITIVTPLHNVVTLRWGSTEFGEVHRQPVIQP